MPTPEDTLPGTSSSQPQPSTSTAILPPSSSSTAVQPPVPNQPNPLTDEHRSNLIEKIKNVIESYSKEDKQQLIQALLPEEIKRIIAIFNIDTSQLYQKLGEKTDRAIDYDTSAQRIEIINTPSHLVKKSMQIFFDHLIKNLIIGHIDKITDKFIEKLTLENQLNKVIQKPSDSPLKEAHKKEIKSIVNKLLLTILQNPPPPIIADDPKLYSKTNGGAYTSLKNVILAWRVSPNEFLIDFNENRIVELTSLEGIKIPFRLKLFEVNANTPAKALEARQLTFNGTSYKASICKLEISGITKNDFNLFLKNIDITQINREFYVIDTTDNFRPRLYDFSFNNEAKISGISLKKNKRLENGVEVIKMDVLVKNKKLKRFSVEFISIERKPSFIPIVKLKIGEGFMNNSNDLTLQDFIAITQEDGTKEIAKVVYALPDGTVFDPLAPKPLDNKLINRIREDLLITPNDDLSVFKICLKQKVIETLFDLNNNLNVKKAFLNLVDEKPKSLLQFARKKLNFKQIHLIDVIDIIEFQKVLLSRIYNTEALLTSIDIQAFFDSIRDNIQTPHLQDFIQNKVTEIVTRLFNKLINTQQNALKINLNGSSLKINRLLNKYDIGKVVPIFFNSNHVYSYARVKAVDEPTVDPNSASQEKKITGFNLEILWANFSPTTNPHINLFNYNHVTFDADEFQKAYTLHVKKIDCSTLESVGPNQSLHSTFKINYTDTIITVPLEMKIKDTTERQSGYVTEFLTQVEILTRLTSAQIKHLKSQSILPESIYLEPHRSAKVTYNVTDSETNKIHTIGYFDSPPQLNDISLKTGGEFKKAIADQVFLNLEKLEIYKIKSPQLISGPRGEGPTPNEVHLILKLDYQWDSKKVSQSIADVYKQDTVLMNLTRNGNSEIFGDTEILHRPFRWWIVAEADSNGLAGTYSYEDFKNIIKNVALALKDKYQLTHAPDTKNISIVLSNNTAIETEKTKVDSFKREWGRAVQPEMPLTILSDQEFLHLPRIEPAEPSSSQSRKRPLESTGSAQTKAPDDDSPSNAKKSVMSYENKHLDAHLPAIRSEVDGWQKPDIPQQIPTLQNTAPVKTIRIIIQLENDVTVWEAARDLVLKAPHSSVLFQRDQEGHLRLVLGNKEILKDTSLTHNMLYVGYGREGNTLGGYEPSELAQAHKNIYAQLKSGWGLKSRINRLSFIGCNLFDPSRQKVFAFDFVTAISNQGTLPYEIGTYPSKLHITPSHHIKGPGHRLDVSGPEVRGAGETKVIFRLNESEDNYIRVGLPEGSLSERTKSMISLMSAPIEGQEAPLTVEQQKIVTEFFHHPDGTLDAERLDAILSNPKERSQWLNIAAQLLQLGDTHAQLNLLSGQEAIKRVQVWNEKQSNGLGHWSDVAMEIQYQNPTLDVKYDMSPQAVFVEDGSLYARKMSTGLLLAWLHAHESGEEATNLLLKGIESQALLNEQQSVERLSDEDTQQVKEFRKHTKEMMISLSDKNIFRPLPWPTSGSFDIPVGNYLIKKGLQVLMLSVRQDSSGIQTVYLYDSNVGQMRIGGGTVAQTRQVLNQVVKSVFSPPTGAMSSPGGELEVKLYHVNLSALEQRPAFRSFQTWLTGLHTQGQKTITLSTVALPIKTLKEMGARIGNKPLSRAHINEMNVAEKIRFHPQKLANYLHNADYSDVITQQAVRFLRQQLYLKGASEMLEGGDSAVTRVAVNQLDAIKQHVVATPTQDVTSRLQIERPLWSTLKSLRPPSRWVSIHKFSGRAGFYMLSYSYLKAWRDVFRNYPERLKDKTLTEAERKQLTLEYDLALASFVSAIGVDLTQIALGVYGSRLSQQALKSTLKMKKVVRGGFILGAFLSVFDIIHATQAFIGLSTTTDPKQRQDLIVKGTLSVAGAALGIGIAAAFMFGGKAAMLAGPLGVLLGTGLLLGGNIYSSVREVEELKKSVSLTFFEELSSGWRAFTGQDFAPDVDNPLRYNQTKAHAEEKLRQLKEKQAKKILQTYGQVSIVYTSRDNIVLEEKFYKKLTSQSSVPDKDKVHPDELEEKKSAHLNKVHRARYVIVSKVYVVDSEYKYYVPSVGGRDYKDHTDMMVTESVGHRQLWGRFVDGDQKTLIQENELRLGSWLKTPTAVGDFNGDGYSDVAYFGFNGLSFLFSDKDKQGAYGPVTTYKREDTFSTLHNSGTNANVDVYNLVGDINNDGLDDIVFCRIRSSTEIQILLAKKTGGFDKQEINLPGISSETTPLLIDANQDGRPDLLGFSENGHKLHLFYGNGTPNNWFNSSNHKEVSLAAFSRRHRHHVSGDIDGDGLKDIVSFSTEGVLLILLGKTLKAYLKNPSNTAPVERLQQRSVPVQKLNEGFNHAQLQLHDMNNDGRSDLVVIDNEGKYTISWGQDNGRFSEPTDDTTGEEQGKPLSYVTNTFPRNVNLSEAGPDHTKMLVGILQDPNGRPAILSLNNSGELYLHNFSRLRLEDTTAYYMPGAGNQTILTRQDRRIEIDVDAGEKHFTTSPYNDTFLLKGQPAPSTPSHLNGGKGQDTIIVAVKPDTHSGYEMNLKLGYVKYIDDQKIIAKLENIENAIGHANTNDTVVGNDENNLLDGRGGKDDLEGHKGNDTLILHPGTTASGEEGYDSYILDRQMMLNSKEDRKRIEVKETPGEASNILLRNYKVGDLIDMALQPGRTDVMLRLKNDNNSYTELVLKDVYRVEQGSTLRLQHHYFFYTSDGRLLGFPITLTQNDDGRYPELRLKSVKLYDPSSSTAESNNPLLREAMAGFKGSGREAVSSTFYKPESPSTGLSTSVESLGRT